MDFTDEVADKIEKVARRNYKNHADVIHELAGAVMAADFGNRDETIKERLLKLIEDSDKAGRAAIASHTSYAERYLVGEEHFLRRQIGKNYW